MDEDNTFENIELRLPRKVVERLQKLADEAGVTIEQVIAVLIVVGLPALDERDG